MDRYLEGFKDGQKKTLEYIRNNEQNCLNCHKEDCVEVQVRQDPFYTCKNFTGKEGKQTND